MFKIRNILISIFIFCCLIINLGCAPAPPTPEARAKSAADQALVHRNEYREAMRSYQTVTTADEKQQALDNAKTAMEKLRIEVQSSIDAYNNAKAIGDESPLGDTQRAQKFLRQVELTCDADGNPKTDQDTLDQMNRWDTPRGNAEYAQDDAKRHTKAYQDAMKDYSDNKKTDDERAEALQKMKVEKKAVEDAIAAADLAVENGKKDGDKDDD